MPLTAASAAVIVAVTIGALLLPVAAAPHVPVAPREITVATVPELTAALAAANPGDTIYLRGGTYQCAGTLTIDRAGERGRPIRLHADPKDAERPRLDFSAQAENPQNRGIVLANVRYWHVKGLDIRKAGDNGLHIRGGGDNTIEFCTFAECADSGLQIGGGSERNTVRNCDSFYNADATRENADGFACKMDAGTGNRFVGCRAWRNLDDGWDGYLRGADGIRTTYEDCWAFENGYLKDGRPSGGDGNGFKTGGSDNKLLKHDAVLRSCLAAGNAVRGFDHNSNRGSVTLENCAAHGNGTNMGFGRTNPLASLTLKNCVVLGPLGSVYANRTSLTHNSWQEGFACEASDFVSVDRSQLTKPRRADGGLPEITYLHPSPKSRLIDRGVEVGLPFHGSAPDLGPFESGDTRP